MEFMKVKQHVHKDDILFTKDTQLPYILFVQTHIVD